MKLFLSVFLLICSYSSWAISIVGDDAYPPYSFSHNGKITGIYTEIIQHALVEMKNTSRINAMPWKRGLSKLKANSIDALFPPYNRPKLRPYMSYSTDILTETLVIVCSEETASRLKSFPADYAGIRLGKNSGFEPGEAVDAAVNDNVIKLHEAKGMAGNLKKLVNNRIDCYVNDRLSILYELKKMAGRGEYDGKSIVETYVIGIEKGYLAINKDATANIKSFISNFNNVIEEMKLSGKIDEIVAKYIQ